MSLAIPQIGNLSTDQVRAALLAAVAAPSLHNSQPWLFRCTDTAIEVFADHLRDIPVADPDRRELLLACGAAVLNLRIAIRAMGVHAAVRLLPDADRRDLLAEIRPQGRIRPTPQDLELASAIARRHTNRRPFLPTEVPAALVTDLRAAARAEQGWIAPSAPAQQLALRTLLAQAHHAQLHDPHFVAEWSRWTGRPPGHPDGVPIISSGPRPEAQDLWVLRDFGAGAAPGRPAGKDFEPDPLIAVVGSFHDLPLAQLQAGQAMQRVLLHATAAGLSASFLSQVVEVPVVRRRLRDLIGGGVWPQTVLRIGYGSPVPATPRRSLDEFLLGCTV